MYAKKFIDDINSAKVKDTNSVLNDSTKGAMVGASVGAGLGLLIGMVKRKNLLMSTFIGSILGAGISRVFINKK